jgi:hypothetical protein
MNITSPLQTNSVIAKTCGCQEKRKVTYSFSEEFHTLCIDKKDILQAEIEACGRLLKYLEGAERETVEKEIVGLKMALDLLT